MTALLAALIIKKILYLRIMTVLGDVFEDVHERVGVLGTLGVKLRGLEHGGCHTGVAQDGQQRVPVYHVVVFGVPRYIVK